MVLKGFHEKKFRKVLLKFFYVLELILCSVHKQRGLKLEALLFKYKTCSRKCNYCSFNKSMYVCTS
jgi:hypothetical protein